MKKLEDYAHLYLCCNAIITDGDGKQKKFVLNAYNLNYYRDYISDVKIILRPLESMTDEEKKNLANCLEGVSHLSSISVLAEVNRLIDGWYRTVTNIPPRNWMKASVYLRSIGIDVDLLEEAGLAVYETETKK